MDAIPYEPPAPLLMDIVRRELDSYRASIGRTQVAPIAIHECTPIHEE